MDKIKITILEDGTIKVETDTVSEANHLNCEQFLREMSKLAGGETTIKHKHGTHGHAHTHHLGESEHLHH